MLEEDGFEQEPSRSDGRVKFSNESTSRTRRNDNSSMFLGGGDHTNASMYDHTSITGSVSEDGNEDEIRNIKRTINQETKAVQRLRVVVLLVMLALAGAVTTATYIFLSDQEEDDFKSSFELYASTIIESSGFSASGIRSSANDFSDYMSSSAAVMNSDWPFVTFPDFERRANSLRELTGAVGVVLLPIVQEYQEFPWSAYTQNNTGWIGTPQEVPGRYVPRIFTIGQEGEFSFGGPTPFKPVWQMNPLPVRPVVNYNMATINGFGYNPQLLEELKEVVTSDIMPNRIFTSVFPNFLTEDSPDEPHSMLVVPVFETVDGKPTEKLVAEIHVFLRWNIYFSNLLPDNVRGINVVLRNTLNTTVTWNLEGKKATYEGSGDLHDPTFDSYCVSTDFEFVRNRELALEAGATLYTVEICPTSELEDEYKTALPVIITTIVGCVFLIMIGAFVAYDEFQRRRNVKVVYNAARSNELLTSVFPKSIRDRLLPTAEETGKANRRGSAQNGTTGNFANFFMNPNKGKLQNFLDGENSTNTDDEEVAESIVDKPIADLFLDTTVMFADIAGFTAWSSVREPSQVFTLLEKVFSSIDQLAKRRRGVFKVETVGDCYVAVSGLPEPRKDHALVMARFSRDILFMVQDLVKKLELSLGPDTGDLGVRIGLHSGAVTAGVLRGDRARFQLFGDTVNTASRIESSGARNRVHVSKETADLLKKSGKGHWLRRRKEMVDAKGKGLLETFWLDCRDSLPATAPPSDRADSKQLIDESESDMWGDAEVGDSNNKIERLIDWQVDVFTRQLKQVVAHRNAITKARGASSEDVRAFTVDSAVRDRDGTCFDEVKEIIELPEFDPEADQFQEDPEKINLGKEVTEQLRSYISAISLMYRKPNGFHNFEHACHVTMSVTKLLSRIVAPSQMAHVGEDGVGERTLHDHTYGITSDPLTHFSLVFSALIHDVDHTGVPNATLIEENAALAQAYSNKSVAEQNSIDLAWGLLQQEQFASLRECIYASKSEHEHFRQLVVQAVLATDIVDKELKGLRNGRWEKAFSEEANPESPKDAINRKATIVIEHLIQASDVAHTMQHWHVYLKWNRNFFFECYQAYLDGRAKTDPSLGWYKGEIGFFDFYIIPLAKKLKKCGVFGVSSDEYLNYALTNRQEWENRGQEVVEEMKRAVLSQTNALVKETQEGPLARAAEHNAFTSI